MTHGQMTAIARIIEAKAKTLKGQFTVGRSWDRKRWNEGWPMWEKVLNTPRPKDMPKDLYDAIVVATKAEGKARVLRDKYERAYTTNLDRVDQDKRARVVTIQETTDDILLSLWAGEEMADITKLVQRLVKAAGSPIST